jgi:hypothetical protein
LLKSALSRTRAATALSTVRTMRRAPRLSFLLAALASAVTFAAPSTPEAIDSPLSNERDERALPDRLRGADSNTGSRTIDLLIDMQQRSAGLQFNERQRPSGSSEVKPRAAPNGMAPTVATQPVAGTRAEAPPTPPSGLFGSGATPLVQTARTATVEPRGGAGPDSAPQRRPGATSTGEPLPRWLLLPREIIEYVRENRWLVLSSVAGGLLLIWGISALFARAAANAGRVPGPQGGRELSADRWGSTRREVRPSRRRSHRRPG